LAGGCIAKHELTPIPAPSAQNLIAVAVELPFAVPILAAVVVDPSTVAAHGHVEQRVQSLRLLIAAACRAAREGACKFDLNRKMAEEKWRFAKKSWEEGKDTKQ